MTREAVLGRRKLGPRPISIGQRITDAEKRLKNLNGMISELETERLRLLVEIARLGEERNR